MRLKWMEYTGWIIDKTRCVIELNINQNNTQGKISPLNQSPMTIVKKIKWLRTIQGHKHIQESYSLPNCHKLDQVDWF